MRYAFRSILLGAVLMAGLSLLAASPTLAQGQATQQEIRTMLENRDQQIKEILRGTDDYTTEQREELKTLINGVIDFRAMGQVALGPFWEDLSEAEQGEFIDVFRDIVRAQSLSDLEVYNSRVTFDEITVEGDSAYVRTTTEYQGTKTPVEYILELEADEWLAEDIVVDGVSTAEGYARSFQTVVRKRGFDALMTSLKKKREQVQS
jgi:phospholipid transport system substrate-binding protein